MRLSPCGDWSVISDDCYLGCELEIFFSSVGEREEVVFGS